MYNPQASGLKAYLPQATTNQESVRSDKFRTLGEGNREREKEIQRILHAFLD
jgi:hypothetical protein